MKPSTYCSDKLYWKVTQEHKGEFLPSGSSFLLNFTSNPFSILKLIIHRPDSPLNMLIKSMVYYEGYSGETDFETILPDGSIQLIITLDEENRKSISKPSSLNDLWFTGIQTQPLTYQAERNATTLSIQFETGGLFHLSKIPASEFKNQLIDATLLSGLNLIELRDQLMSIDNGWKRITFACNYFQAFVPKKTCPSLLVKEMVNTLKTSGCSLSALTQQSGYSAKHINHLFNTYIGVSPKKVQRLSRFNNVLQLLHSHTNAHHLDLTFDHQYFDQAHYINDFKSFTKLTPTQYLKQKSSYPHVLFHNSMER